MAAASGPRFVTSSDGVQVATYEEGNPDGPTLVLAHGWPDSHVLWDGVVPLLAAKFRIIRYDNRGSGASSVPKPVRAYTMAGLADDFAAVIGALSPGAEVHVLAHDWGSVGVWEYLSRPGADDRVASFTSVSGPSADHYGIFIRSRLARPYRPIRFLRALSLAGRLTYWLPFAVPGVAPAVMRAGYARRLQARDTPKPYGGSRRLYQSDRLDIDAANSMKIYRARVFHTSLRGRRDHYVSVPVQLICNDSDPVVRGAGYADEHRWVPRLWRRDLAAGHWAPMSHPQVLARAVTELVDFLAGEPAARELLRAQVGRPRKPFGDTLVSVTGAGSGIGRATALAFARDGAELIVSDIDEAGAKATAQRIIADGGVAHAHQLDVSDDDAVEAFAELVCASHGVPDIVVNNAGIAQAGAFLDTPADAFNRVLDVNLGGVVSGSRAFGKRLVERGTGGHIVNVSSMAAYLPTGSMAAYNTSKAAVFMFSDTLRAELAAAGIGVSTICPGIVDTDIVRTTRVDLPDAKPEEAQRRQAAVVNMYRKRGYGPEKVAEAIVSAVENRTAIRPVTPEAYAAYVTSRLAPAALRRAARRQPF